MLFSSRKRKAELEAAEADGESLWTDSFSSRVRVKFQYAMRDSAGDHAWRMLESARDLVLRDEGLHSLTGRRESASDDFMSAVSNWDDDKVPTLVEAVAIALDGESHGYPVPADAQQAFVRRVNEILEEHRVSYELVDHRMIEFRSREMHVAVVQPALRLLSGDGQFVEVEDAYQDALREISEHHYADAVTDAARALQEALLAVGCTGKSLGPLLKSAVSLGLIVERDKKLVDWVSSERSQVGDAHVATAATRSDAWLSVHVVGAVILRLMSGDAGRG